MTIKWVKVWDEFGNAHEFDNDLDEHHIEVNETPDGVLILRHLPNLGYAPPKQETRFNSYSLYQVMRAD